MLSVQVQLGQSVINSPVGCFSERASLPRWQGLSYTQNPQTGALAILEEQHYYPFGLRHANYNSDLIKIDREEALKTLKEAAPPSVPLQNPGYAYKYNGKELQNEFGVEMYDFGARNYDPALGRWMNIDPLAEMMSSKSPYIYAFNNPTYFFDSDGNIPIPQIINYIRESSGFGMRQHPITKEYKGHAGIDLTAVVGSEVRAAARGKIVKIGWDIKTSTKGIITGYGRYVVIQHAEGYYTLYAHLEKYGSLCTKGDEIENGQVIAYSGNTGGSTGPHLHFEIINAGSLNDIFKKDNKIDPWSINDLDAKLHGSGMGPHLSPSEYSSGGGFDLLSAMHQQWVSDVQKNNQNSSSTATTSGVQMPQVSPASTITPMPVVPMPLPLPGGGSTPSPIPNPGGAGGSGGTITPPTPSID